MIFKKCKSLLFKRDFKIAEILSKNILFLYFTGRPKNGKGNKQRRRPEYIIQE